MLPLNAVSQGRTILSFGLGVGRGKENQRQHGIVATRGAGQGASRLGPGTGAPDQPWGSHIPCQGITFLVCEMMCWNEELFRAPSSSRTLQFYMGGGEEGGGQLWSRFSWH